MDATKWTQGFQEMINVKPMEQMISNTNQQQQQQTFITTAATRPNTTVSNGGSSAAATTMETRKARPQEKVNCPRCNSTNTKFCYYNNYSLTQPRYFCKGCRRYWTEGGSLRNVPVGGSSRKNKRSSTPLASNPKLPDLNPPILFSTQIPNKTSKDLNLLSFPVMQDHHHGMSQFLHMPKIENNNNTSSSSIYASSSPALELLRSNGVMTSRGMNTFLPGHMMDSNSVLYSSLGFPTMVDYKQSSNNLSFSIDHHQGMGHNNINGSNQRGEDNNNDEMNGASKVLFPFSDTTQEKSHGNNSNNTYWSGMFSNTGGSSW